MSKFHHFCLAQNLLTTRSQTRFLASLSLGDRLQVTDKSAPKSLKPAAVLVCDAALYGAAGDIRTFVVGNKQVSDKSEI